MDARNAQELKQASDEELSIAADTGLSGQGAVVEMMSRLKSTIKKLDTSTTKYSKMLLRATMILVFFALVQIIMGVLVLPILSLQQISLFIFLFIVLWWGFKSLEKDIFDIIQQ